MCLSTLFFKHPIAFDKIPIFIFYFQGHSERKHLFALPLTVVSSPSNVLYGNERVKRFFSPFKNWGDVFIHVTRSPNGNNLSMEITQVCFARALASSQPALIFFIPGMFVRADFADRYIFWWLLAIPLKNWRNETQENKIKRYAYNMARIPLYIIQ